MCLSAVAESVLWAIACASARNSRNASRCSSAFFEYLWCSSVLPLILFWLLTGCVSPRLFLNLVCDRRLVVVGWNSRVCDQFPISTVANMYEQLLHTSESVTMGTAVDWYTLFLLIAYLALYHCLSGSNDRLASCFFHCFACLRSFIDIVIIKVLSKEFFVSLYGCGIFAV